MYEPREAPDHPLLEGQYIGFYRLECDDNHPEEVCTPLIVELVQGKLNTIFKVEDDIQNTCMIDVEQRFRTVLQQYSIATIVSPMFFEEQFFGFPHFLNLDSKERQRGYDEIKNWVEYGGIDESTKAYEWARLLRDSGILTRGYLVKEKRFFDTAS